MGIGPEPHILLRTGPTPLSKVVRRLMTGYAVTFTSVPMPFRKREKCLTTTKEILEYLQ